MLLFSGGTLEFLNTFTAFQNCAEFLVLLIIFLLFEDISHEIRRLQRSGQMPRTKLRHSSAHHRIDRRSPLLSEPSDLLITSKVLAITSLAKSNQPIIEIPRSNRKPKSR
ncbi:unnamed protein product, partial [Allacma fusca]